MNGPKKGQKGREVLSALESLKAARAVAVNPIPGISSTGVQKPKAPESGQPLERELTPISLVPFLLGIDWLTLNMEAPPPHPMRPLPWECLEPRRWWDEIDPDVCYYTDPQTIRTAQFGRITYLRDDRAEKMATISSDPHQPGRRGSGWIQVQFHNEALTTGKWSTLFRMFRNIGCEYSSVSRIDLACDGMAGDGGEWPKVMDMERTGAAKYWGKCDWLTRKSRTRITGGEFGTRASNKFIRAYCKTREMKRKGVKAHLVDAWEDCLGFDPMAEGVEIHRFEVQLKGKEIRRYFQDERKESFVHALSDQRRRVDIFASMAVPMFDFRTPAKRGRDSVPVCQWDWSRVRADGPVIAERATRNISLTDHTIKTGIRAMVMLGMKTGDKDALNMARRYAVAAGPVFERWHDAKLIQWVKEFAAIARTKDERAFELFFAFEHRTDDNDTEWPQMEPPAIPLDNTKRNPDECAEYMRS